jgi:membrane associated rhomboid family serine protease
MGLYDRDYYRERGRGIGSLSRWSINTWIIVINVAIFLLEFLSPSMHRFLEGSGYFSTQRVSWDGGLQFWRFLTFQFLHRDPLHIGFNMLGLYIFGGMVEEHLGRKKYLAFYLTCGVFGAFMYMLLNAAGVAWDSLGFRHIPFLLFYSTSVPLIGASAGVLGIIMACAYIAPGMQVQLLFPPVVVRIKTLAYFYVLLAILSLFFGGQNAGGEAAHLGGAAAGAFFIRNSHLLRDFFDVYTDSRKTPPRAQGRRPEEVARARQEREAEEREIDRILAKAHAEGIASLTESEKATLRRDTENRRARG